MVYWQTNQSHSEELDENFILPYMPICAIYMYIGIYIYMCRTFITRERTKKNRLKNGNCRLGKQTMKIIRLG